MRESLKRGVFWTLVGTFGFAGVVTALTGLDMFDGEWNPPGADEPIDLEASGIPPGTVKVIAGAEIFSGAMIALTSGINAKRALIG